MLVYGKNVALEILNSDKKVNKLYLSDTFADEKISLLIKNRKINPIFKTKKELMKIEENDTQGIILDIDDFEYINIEDTFNDNVIVILDHIEDPHNFGAIIRTCESAGIRSIIIPKDRSTKINSTVMKTSSGALINVNICMVTNLNYAIKKLKEAGFWIYGTDMDGKPYNNIDFFSKTCIIIGNEGKGISSLIKENCDFILSIPMLGKVNSLNASVAAGIIIYEVINKIN